MPVGSFSKYVSGFTSDHTYQSATISTETADHKALSLTGLTWNLLNKCHSEAMGGYSNNPFDLDETEKSYALRKKSQLKLLWKNIEEGNVDYIFLQEVDIFSSSQSQPFVKSFLKALRHKGWEIVHSDSKDDMKQPVITLCNGNKLTLESKRAVCKSKSGRFTALEAVFVDKATGAKVCLTNMHLDYETDHSNDILAYQQAQVEKKIFTIIGGDTNPHANVEYHTLIGDENTSTSIKKNGETLRHDGFMASPADIDTRVTIVEKECAYFKWVPTNALIKMYKDSRGQVVIDGKFTITTIDPAKAHLTHTTHISLPGMPWIRKAFEYLLVIGGKKEGV